MAIRSGVAAEAQAQQEHQDTVFVWGKEAGPICTPLWALLDQLSLFQHEVEKGMLGPATSKSLGA